MTTVDFYFDFSSPNAYFAAVQLKRITKKEKGISVDWKPVFLGGIMKNLETTPPAMQNELKANYLLEDLKRWGKEYEIPFNFPSDFPVNSLEALRAFLVLGKTSSVNAVPFARRVFERAWVDDTDVSRLDVLRECLPNDVKPEFTIEDEIKRDDIKDELKQRTDDAMDRGVFGCPTFFVDDEMFWGKDRLGFVKRRLGVE
ncbi:MAG: 2-hydroxychromene-2-carboxylate isomerase [bacterium]